MKANPDKCHLLVTTNTLTSVNINGFQITNSAEEKLLGNKFHSELSFENQVSNLCKKASQKLDAMTTTITCTCSDHMIVNYMNLSKRKYLMKGREGQSA